jgi:uncharacterized membrane protein
MKNRLFRWGVIGAVIGAVSIYRQYSNHVIHTGTEWLLLLLAYTGVFMLLMFLFTAIMQKLQKNNDQASK